ncbi:transposase, IS605 OrfB family [Fibrisoma limi BUZ 3]|uniref:Transposase, IS605 OrfB family n=1 Tax=Fibrisoma limi BUZ 3 TaxID=1185876 RepID=I2GKQ5_9BACT|nr:RNA-guided endonuclease TnpB family protein [Fibrisoma limi]CCH54481.1 transposase, IS605 OrfB family [Fibrisoma limi BUZ 3]
MKLTAKIKLLPTKRQAELLLTTIKEANSVCNALSDWAWEKKKFKQFELHRERYYPTKETCQLSSQVIIRCISKVADSYKLDKSRKRIFRLTGAVAYDSRILTYNTTKKRVSIWAIEGRQKIAYVGGKHNEALLAYQKGESDLLYTKGKFFLLATCEVPDDQTETPEDVLGVDLGITNLATDSDGQSFSGATIEATRQWYQKRRSVLQSVGTKSAKRRLKKLSGGQRNFQKNTNHVISKQLVTKAKGTHRAIALEDLTGIRERATVRKAQRTKHTNWSFGQLRQHITYKAIRYGVPVLVVNPRNTSRTCNKCGYCKKANRKSQSEFVCRLCGHSANADENAALNIRNLGLINRPMVASQLH